MSTPAGLKRRRRRRSCYCSSFLIGVATTLLWVRPPAVDFVTAFLIGRIRSCERANGTGRIQCDVGSSSSSTQLGVRHGPRNKNGGPVTSNSNSYGKNKSIKKDKASSTAKKTQSLQSTPQQQQQQQQQQAPKRKKSVPPWQVLSTQEAKRNLELEKERRAAIQAGVLPTDATVNDLRKLPQQQSTASPPQRTLSKAFLDPASSKLLNWRRFNPTTQPAGLRFVGAYLDDAQLPPRRGVPEIAFLGRSNVGKSSLLNCLSQSALRGRGGSGQQQQARVGQTPGATASVNMYVLQDARERDLLAWMDLPGFGYAQLSKVTQERIQAAAERYLHNRRELALGILLVDVRRTPSDDDRAVLAALYDRRVPLLVVATKLDKFNSANARERQLQIIRDGLGLPDHQPLAVSSVTGEGCRELWRILLEACERRVTEVKSRYDATAAAELLADDQAEGEDDAEEMLAEKDDGDGLAYNQGYDWIHGNPILYENEDPYNGDAGSDQFYLDEEKDTMYEPDDLEFSPPARETLKSLKRKARDMERRGEV